MGFFKALFGNKTTVTVEEKETKSNEKIGEEEINKIIQKKDWDSLELCCFQLAQSYSDSGQSKKALDMFLMSYCVELNSYNYYGDNDFSPQEAPDSYAKGLAADLIKGKNYAFDDAVLYINSITKHLHEKYGFPIKPKEFSKRISREMF